MGIGYRVQPYQIIVEYGVPRCGGWRVVRHSEIYPFSPREGSGLGDGQGDQRLTPPERELELERLDKPDRLN